jgi:hypothetical protein
MNRANSSGIEDFGVPEAEPLTAVEAVVGVRAARRVAGRALTLEGSAGYASSVSSIDLPVRTNLIGLSGPHEDTPNEYSLMRSLG